jgi:hypothetical protein
MNKKFLMAIYIGRNAALIMHKDGQRNRKCDYTLSKLIFTDFIVKEMSLWNLRKEPTEP